MENPDSSPLLGLSVIQEVTEKSSTNRRFITGSFDTEVLHIINGTVAELTVVWNKLGIYGDARDERLISLVDHHIELQKQMIDEENVLLRKIETNVEELQEELKMLRKHLHLVAEDVQLSCETLLQKQELLTEKVEVLLQIKDQRLNHFEDLFGKQKELCDMLGEPEHYQRDETTIPSEEFLYEMEQNIDLLKMEKSMRENKCVTIQAEIFDISRKIDVNPDNTFQKNFLYKEEGLVLSKQNLQLATDWLDKLKTTYAENKAKMKDLESRLTMLWDCFSVDHYDREMFYSENSDYTEKAMKAFCVEIERLEAERKSNLESFIQKLRIELVSIWNKCHVGEGERRNFKAYYDDCFTEELMQVHEEELKKWKSHYELSKSIYDGLAKRQSLWKEMLDLEAKATDPSRYVNRGGNLLQEEKERKKLRVLLPKLENDIHHLIQDYVERTNVPFRIDGLEFEVYCSRQWEQHNQDKEDQKLQRQMKRQEEDHFTMYGPTTPNKRRLQTTAFRTPAKQSRLQLPSTSRTPLLRAPPTQTPTKSIQTVEVSSTKKSPKRRVPASASRISPVRNRRAALRPPSGSQSANRPAAKGVKKSQPLRPATGSTPLGARNNPTSTAQREQEVSLMSVNYSQFKIDLNQKENQNLRSTLTRPQTDMTVASSTSSRNSSKSKVLGSKLSPRYNNNGSIRSRKSIGVKRNSRNASRLQSTQIKSDLSINRSCLRNAKFSAAGDKKGLPFLF